MNYVEIKHIDAFLEAVHRVLLGEGVGLMTEAQHHRLEQLYDQYALLLWKTAYGALQDKQLSEQAVQLVFQEIWTNPHLILIEKRRSIVIVNMCLEKVNHLQTDYQKQA